MNYEHWKTIEGFEDYQISDQGRVRSLKKEKPFIMKTFDNGRGYQWVCFWRGGKPSRHYIHRLVAQSFISPIPDGLHVSHINENNQDNRAINLCLETPSENARRPLHCKRQGASRRISKTGLRGVYYRKSTGKFLAQMTHGGRPFYLGSYATAKDAAIAFDKKAIELRGGYATTNRDLGLLEYDDGTIQNVGK